MKELVKHLLKNNLDEIVSRSILNCHCEGLHSIMLLESPGKTIRLYISTPGNKLWKNNLDHKFYNPKEMVLAFHTHHCNLTLHCVTGSFINWNMKRTANGNPFQAYLYKSKISDGELAFSPLYVDNLLKIDSDVVFAGDSIYLEASDIHTVSCNKNEWASWLVYEGKEDPDYKPICWSRGDMNKVNPSLYQKPTADEICFLLTEIGLL